jgi:hypothetical protein
MSTSPQDAPPPADAPTRVQRLVRSIDRSPLGAVAAVAVALLATVTGLVYATGGTHDAYLHAMYLPVLLVAFRAGPMAGVATGLAGGVAIGPWMPLDVASDTAQEATSWVVRSAFFALTGAVVGTLARELRARLDRVAALRRSVTQQYGASLRTLAAITSRRDDLGVGHAERVGHNAAVIGLRLGLAEHHVGRLYWAGLLHGLGRFDVEADAEPPPGALDALERAALRAHATAGRDLLASLTRTWSDATAYPTPSLENDATPLSHRIVRVAEAFDHLVAPRPYRPGLSPDEARRVVVGGIGRSYDARVVAAFEAALADGALVTQGTPPIGEAAQRYLTTFD